MFSHYAMRRMLMASAVTIPTAFSFRTAHCAATMSNEEIKEKMPYTRLGGTGLIVSRLSFGFWATFGSKQDNDNVISVMQCARKSGVNLFDNAEVYGAPRGTAETIMGDALQWLMSDENPDKNLWERSKIIVTTKIFWGGDDINEKGLSRKHVKEGMSASLKRLQLEYVDLVFCHRPDQLTSTEEVVRGMTQLINEGKALYWGTSEWSAQQITEAYWIAKVHNLIPPCMEQPQYNLFHRERFEKEYAPLWEAPYNYGSTIWSPLASGVLTGKYNKGIPKGSRLDAKGYEFLARGFEKSKAEKIPKVQRLMEIADRLDCSVTQLSIAWCVKNNNVSTVLLGSSKQWQLEENLASVNVLEKLTPEVMQEIEDIMDNKPKMGMDYGRSLL